MKTYHFVYVLRSEAHTGAHYTGLTDDLADRLARHNRGEMRHTAKFRPWRIAVAVAFEERTKAAAFERYLKSGSGREFARRHF